jgi:hypothetical protein
VFSVVREGRFAVIGFRRTVRTPQSDQFQVVDWDRLTDDGLPLGVGRLDVHYTESTAVATLLLWEEYLDVDIRHLVDLVVDELLSADGVPADYMVDVVTAHTGNFYSFSSFEEGQEQGNGDARA